MGQNKYIPPHKPNTHELVCPNDGLSYFETEYENSFYAKCHLCRWLEPSPDYKVKISDEEMLAVIAERWKAIRAKIEPWPGTPDEILAHKYTQEEIYGKLEEFEHRDLIEYGVSLRTGWLTKKGETLYEKSAERQ